MHCAANFLLHIQMQLSSCPCGASQEESVDVKALRARFNSKANNSDASSRDSGSPKSPRPAFGRVVLPVTENNLAHHRLSPIVPPPVAGPGPIRFPRVDPMAASIPSRSVFPRPPPPSPAVRASIQQADATKVKQTGEMLQNMMLRHQRPPGFKPVPAPGMAPATGKATGKAPAPPQASTPAVSSNMTPLRHQPRQRSGGEVAPLRRPLPPEGHQPLKPKRPPHVNLEPFMRFSRGPALPPPRKSNGECVWLRVSSLTYCTGLKEQMFISNNETEIMT